MKSEYRADTQVLESPLHSTRVHNKCNKCFCKVLNGSIPVGGDPRCCHGPLHLAETADGLRWILSSMAQWEEQAQCGKPSIFHFKTKLGLNKLVKNIELNLNDTIQND